MIPSKPMRIRDALASGLPRADAEILLADLLGKPRTWVLAHDEEELTGVQAMSWEERRERRVAGEPVARIVGRKEFHGCAFRVAASTLVPRPATEALVDAALRFLERPSDGVEEIDAGIVAVSRVLKPGLPRCIVDVGTGSGCVAVTLALSRPTLRVIGTDIDEDALRIAAENGEEMGAGGIDWQQGSALDPVLDLAETFVVVSNPPYIPDGTTLDRDVAAYDPPRALFGGPDGADVIRHIVAQATAHPYCLGFVLECRSDQIAIIDSPSVSS
jgi:release factor glutamine methyltransferase